MLLFDEQGLLTPAEGIPAFIDELYDELVLPFPDSKTREHLFQNWMKYNQLLRQEIGADVVQWVDGSFVTQKLNPRDLDIVSFIPSHLFRKFEKRLDYYWTDNWEREGIDAYLVEIITPSDAEFLHYRNVLNKWHQLYTRTKVTSVPPDSPKGYLIINIL